MMNRLLIALMALAFSTLSPAAEPSKVDSIASTASSVATRTGRAIERGAKKTEAVVKPALDRAGAAVGRAAKKTGAAVKRGAEKTEAAVKKGARKTGEFVHKGAEKVEAAVKPGSASN